MDTDELKKQSAVSRGRFSGRIGYILAVAGSAVGLGNIWRFPYLAAKYGGGMFLLVYLILMVTFGYVMIISETALGRMTKKSPVGAFHAFGKRLPFHLGGWINAVVPMLIVPYYCVIGGWVFKYLFEYLRGSALIGIAFFLMFLLAALSTCILIIRVVGFEKPDAEIESSSAFRRKKMYHFFLKYLVPICIGINIGQFHRKCTWHHFYVTGGLIYAE